MINLCVVYVQNPPQLSAVKQQYRTPLICKYLLNFIWPVPFNNNSKLRRRTPMQTGDNDASTRLNEDMKIVMRLKAKCNKLNSPTRNVPRKERYRPQTRII